MANERNIEITDCWIDSPDSPLMLVFEVEGNPETLGITVNEEDDVYMYFCVNPKENKWVVEIEIINEDGYGDIEAYPIDGEKRDMLQKKAEEYVENRVGMSMNEYCAKCDGERIKW